VSGKSLLSCVSHAEGTGRGGSIVCPGEVSVSKRVVSPDPVYGDVLVAKMIHAIMLDGKARRRRERRVRSPLDVLKEKTKRKTVAVLKKANREREPVVEVKSPQGRRRAPTRSDRDPSGTAPVLSIRWLVGYAPGAGPKRP